MFSLAAAERSSSIFLLAASAVALPRKDKATHFSVFSSRNTTRASFGFGISAMVLPAGITKETNQSFDLLVSTFWAAITGAVMAIFCDAVLPFDM